MKKKLLFAVSLTVMLVCLFAISVNAACTEHQDSWTIVFGENGYLGEVTAVNTCSVSDCNTTIAVEKIDPMFETLGYSYSASGGVTQRYAANRAAIARYEELSGEKVSFGVVAATRNNVEENPLDENGLPVNDKVKAADFTSTEYDLFDVMVNNIPEAYWGNTQIICCAYIIAGSEITYIENGVEKINASANTFTRVSEKVENAEVEAPEINTIKIIDKVKYKVLSLEDLSLTKWAFWQSDGNSYNTLQVGTGSTHKKFFATRQFDKAELPNGTIISVESGWQYRPEAWVNGGKNNGENSTSQPSRPKTTSASVVVDNEWWGSFTTRAFNITPGSAISSDTTAEDIYEIFKIYVPLVIVSEPSDSVPVIPDGSETPTEPETPPTTEDTEKQNWNDDGALKILCIGNSFSVDSMEYVYQVAQAAGVENIVLGNLYIGGCSLATHLSNATNDSGSYTYYKNTSGSWSSTGGYKISTAVKSDDWDFISFQQVSGYSGVSESYSDLEALIEIVEPMNPSARLVWHMTWAYQSNSSHGDFSKYDKNQMTMYNAIVSAVQENVVTNEKIDIIIPAGTAIQNVRTSYVGDTLTRDGYHLSYDYGRYIGSLTFVKALTGLSIDNMAYAPSGVTENRVLVAVEAVNNAVAKPFEVTQSSYAEEPEIEVPDTPVVDGTVEIPDGYRQLTLEEMGWQACSFWNSSNFNYNANNAFNTGYYGTTNTFTKEDIPIGSIIILKQGEDWQYRPDGWGGSGSRPGNVTDERVVVDETWWSGYTTRGFNVSKTTHSQSNTVAINNYTPEQIWQVLVILVPDATEGGTDEGGTTNPDEGGTTDPTEGLVLVDYLDWMAGSYWNSTDSENYAARIAGQNNSPYFWATRLFTKEQLPVGSVIVVSEGWQYRPDGWKVEGERNSGSRPDNVTTSVVTIDEAWWGSFTVRGFNISNTSSTKIDSLSEDEINAVFKIYVPESAVEDNKKQEKVDNVELIVNESGLVKSEMCVSEVTVIDGVEYRALSAEAMGLTPFAYYWSEKVLNDLYLGDASTAKKYFATKVFEREELVDGTLIWVADGWQYRPDGWIGTSLNSAQSRPTNKTASAIVDSTWWGSFTTRGFNISMKNTPELEGQGYDTVEEVYEMFKIYIPVDKIAE